MKPKKLMRVIPSYHLLPSSSLYLAFIKLKNGPFPASFSLLSFFQQKTVNQARFQILPMIRFELRTSGIGSDRYANCAHTVYR